MMAESERSISLESIPKDLLLKLQSYRTVKPDCKPSTEDSEVEQCLQNFDPPSPKSSISDDVFIKYPTRRSESDEIEEKRPHSSFSNQLLLSPLPDRECYTSRDEQCEVMKSRSPISPNHRYPQSPFTSIAEQTRVQTGFDRTPIKFHSPSLVRNIEQTSTSKESLQTERSPMRGLPDSHYAQRSPVSRLGTMIKMEQSSPYPREITDPRVLSPAYYHQPHYMEEFPRRGMAAKKQLSFDTPYARPCSSQDMEGYDEMGYTPLKGRYRASSDSDIAGAFGDHLDDEDSRLISKFLQHIHKRKRKMTDRYESDYEDEAYLMAKRKRKQLERKMNMNYLKQLEADVSMLNNKLKQPEPRPDNCSCAIMEKQFLQMSENAYKNIRRQDTSADGFAQFRKELNETNEILKESLEVMQNMREFCEHKQLLKNLTL